MFNNENYGGIKFKQEVGDDNLGACDLKLQSV